jgi:plastocyanin
MMRKIGGLGIFLLLVMGILPASAQAPDPGFLEPVPADDCKPETRYEKAGWRKTASAQAGKKCRRLHFSYGPITVKPGQNDVLIGPVTIEKPAYDGLITRFRPDLVDASGKAPPIDIVHLHHATWLNTYPQYGNGPFFSAGEEKTILPFPRGYGMHVGARDSWLLLYMVHSAVPQPQKVWVTYDIDFVAEDDARKLGMVPAKPVWLDVQRVPISKGAPDTSGNPVFNVQKGFGHRDKRLGQRVCTWPRENCSRFDVYGERTPQQGKRIRVKGADWRVPQDMAGSLITMGGHLHPGGIRDEVSLVRRGRQKRIHISDAVYWNRRKPARAGGPKNSWDFSMTGTGAHLGWKVNLKKGDILRLNATYDSEYASWYENMGIVMAWVAPKDPHGRPAIDVFDDNVRIRPGVPTTARPTRGYRRPTCRPDRRGPQKTLCLRGQVTHGHLAEASNFGGCPKRGCPGLPKKKGSFTSDIPMPAFTYGPADMGAIGTTGIPRVKLGDRVRFWNVDTIYDVWHTVTRCRRPCTGTTGLDYPTADGGSGRRRDRMDFDSTEVGYGVFFSPASGQIGGDKSTEETIRDGLYWQFKPKRTGVYSFYCRIHPSMRGAIKVVK